MKLLLSLLILSLSISIYAKNDLPIMLKIKSNFNLEAPILNTFRSGAEDSLTAQGYVLISKQQQDEALMEQSKQRKSDCYDDACLVDTGKMMAAQMIFVTDINKTENIYIFKVRLLDLETGSVKRTVIKIYKGRLTNIDKLLSFSKNLTNEALNIKEKHKPIALFKVEVNTSPQGASLYVDNEFISKTPALVNVEKGKHKFKISSNKYQDVNYEKDIQSNETRMIKLMPRVYTINIKSNVDKAKVFYKGQYKGVTPLKLKLGIDATQYDIKLQKKGYYNFHHRINENNLDKDLNIDLIELEKYNCTINVFPKNTKIFLSNVYFGKIQFKSGETQKLYKGLYSIKLINKNYSLAKDFDYYIELNKDTERDIIMFKDFTKHLKFQAVTDITIANNLSYLSIGAGAELFNFINDNMEITLLAINFYKNMTDKYFYFDAYNNIKWEVAKGLSLGANVSVIYSTDFATVASGFLMEYKYTLSNTIEIKAFLKTGLSYLDEHNTDIFDYIYLTSGISISSIGF